MSPAREPILLKITHSGSLNMGTVHFGGSFIIMLVENIVQIVFKLSEETGLL
jgi:hypothetical protein